MATIKHIDFRRIDLNLLVTFDALMSTCNVTRAAELLRLGQPAVSHRLARLRALVDDPLFAPTGRGLVPTPRAQALAAEARHLLEGASALLVARPAFDPSAWSGTVRLGLPDTLEMILLPELGARLRSAAPRMKVAVHAVSDWREALGALDAGRLDLYAGFASGLKPWHRQAKLWDENFAAIFSPQRLALKTPLSMKAFVEHPHVMATPRQGLLEGRTDRMLARLRKKRVVAVSTPHFLAVPHLLLRAPYICVMHGRPARRLADAFGLAISVLPFAMGTIPEFLVWHASVDREPAHQWLRRLIADLAATS